MTITINNNKEEAERIQRAVAENEGYCPCQIEKNERTRCMCLNFIEDEKEGWCHCGLYYKTFN
ncbi:MAG: ferredoxin thioredoxin reductase catalytic beta chain [Bacilli bacterium]|nr:ferredoxin thioredoxin reductase catalytic beta chain [Bacilli bacterium]